jgi:transcriptional regulator with XRE-family HTH domain
MFLAKRIREIREYRGHKQSTVAIDMKISQQAYSLLESRGTNARIGTLRRFCKVMNIDLSFLLAYDVEINDETMKMYGNKSYSTVLEEYTKMLAKIEAYESILHKSQK